MHKLDRSAVTPPACLSGHDHATQKGDDLDAACKAAVRAALTSMQGSPGTSTEAPSQATCAYCETAIWAGGHIEHFRRKNPKHFPELTFSWDNLFLSCDARSHCGHYKDRKDAPAYNPDTLVKPDCEDPDAYFYFHSTGELRIRSGLDQPNQHKASETIRVFGLNDRTLQASRAKALKTYKEKILPDLQEIESWPPADRKAYLADEIAATRWHPYATTIKHFLQQQP